MVDWLSGLTAAFMMLIPPMPAEFSSGLAAFTSGMVWVAEQVEPFGILLPIDAIGIVLGVFAALFVFWGGVMAFKAIMWAWGK